MTTYDLPDEILVGSDGPIRVITLNRPDDLNATNHVLHAGLAALFPQLDADDEARVAVITGAGRAFSAGGDFNYIDELAQDGDAPHPTLSHGRQIVTGMVGCRVPIVAAVNGPAVGLGCSLVALSDIVFMAEGAHLADPHVLLGLVAADGGPVVWPLLTSLQLAKEYALTGDRIPAERAAAIGLVNHVCADDEVLDRGAWRARGASPSCPRARWRTPSDHQHPAGAGCARRDRLRAERGGPVVHVTGAAGQPRPALLNAARRCPAHQPMVGWRAPGRGAACQAHRPGGAPPGRPASHRGRGRRSARVLRQCPRATGVAARHGLEQRGVLRLAALLRLRETARSSCRARRGRPGGGR